MNEENKKATYINLDMDVSDPFSKGTIYGYAARVPLDAVLITKIIKSDMRCAWKWIGCTCAITDMLLCEQAARINLPKLMKK